MNGVDLKSAARHFCDSSEKCSECPANSDVDHCLIHAVAESPMDAGRTFQFLASYATCNPVVALAEGTVT